MILSENSEEELDKGKYIEKLEGDIEFKNVSMRYGKEMILKNVSFTIPKCSRVTIVGRTGARKDNNS